MHSLLSLVCQASVASIRCLTALVLTIVIFTGAVPAHELTPAVADLSFDESQGRYTIELELNLEALIAKIGPEHDDTTQSPNAERYDELRAMPPGQLTGELSLFASDLRDGITVMLDDRQATIDIDHSSIPAVGDTEISRISKLVLSGDLPDDAQFLTWQWAQDFGPVVLRTATKSDDEGYAAYLAGGDISEPIAVEGQEARSGWAVFVDYIGIGFEHILPLGLDHILFVVGLFLLSTRLKPLLTQITAFTLAHTVTLALGMAGIVSIPGSIVEPLIAASIVYVAIENILTPNLSPWRTFVVFAFGLLHGLGFAGVLTEFGIPDGQFVTALIGFNIGVELGQLTVIAICFALVGAWFGGASWYRRVIIIPGSILIALIGAYWFIERTLL